MTLDYVSALGLNQSKLELGHPGMGTVFVLLAGATAYTTSTLENTVAQDGDPPLADYHMATLGSNDTADNRAVGHLLEVAAGPGKAS